MIPGRGECRTSASAADSIQMFPICPVEISVDSPGESIGRSCACLIVKKGGGFDRRRGVPLEGHIMRLSRCGSMAVLGVAGLLVAGTRGDERPIDWKDVPAGVRKAADRAFAGARWNEAVLDDEDDADRYRLKGTDARGVRTEVVVAGKEAPEVVETVADLRALDELPAGVRKAAATASAGIRWAEVVVHYEDDQTVYYLRGTDAKGRAIEATLVAEVRVDLVETTIDLADLPKPLADRLRAVPGAQWTRAAEKLGADETTYEATGTDAKGHDLTARLGDDGRITLRTELELEEVPQAVSEALRAAQPRFEPESVALVDEDGTVTYRFGGTEEDEEIEISVTPDGKAVKVVSDEDE
jgi:hypothetical protein